MADEDRNNNADAEKPKFKIVDRRRINPDEIEASDAPPEPEPPRRVAQEEKKEAEAPPREAAPPGEPELEDEDLKGKADPLGYENILLSFLQTLVSVTWVHLGLVAHPQTQLITKKLEEARKSINLFEILLKQAGNGLPSQIKIELERVLQDLKANYVNQL